MRPFSGLSILAVMEVWSTKICNSNRQVRQKDCLKQVPNPSSLVPIQGTRSHSWHNPQSTDVWPLAPGYWDPASWNGSFYCWNGKIEKLNDMFNDLVSLSSKHTQSITPITSSKYLCTARFSGAASRMEPKRLPRDRCQQLVPGHEVGPRGVLLDPAVKRPSKTWQDMENMCVLHRVGLNTPNLISYKYIYIYINYICWQLLDSKKLQGSSSFKMKKTCQKPIGSKHNITPPAAARHMASWRPKPWPKRPTRCGSAPSSGRAARPAV